MLSKAFSKSASSICTQSCFQVSSLKRLYVDKFEITIFLNTFWIVLLEVWSNAKKQCFPTFLCVHPKSTTYHWPTVATSWSLSDCTLFQLRDMWMIQEERAERFYRRRTLRRFLLALVDHVTQERLVEWDHQELAQEHNNRSATADSAICSLHSWTNIEVIWPGGRCYIEFDSETQHELKS